MFKMQRSNDNNEDGISNLPASIIDTILARMPLRDAVRTSVLSREWRNKWKSIPSLIFDYRFDRFRFKPEELIRHVLVHHSGRLNNFALKIVRYNAPLDCIRLLPTYQIQDFTLHLCGLAKRALDLSFFSFENLMHLNLYGCVLYPPPQFEGFKKLITLDFQEVEFAPAVFMQFISRSLLLERVRLVDCTEIDSLEFEGPCLKVFTFHGDFKTIHFKNSPLLAEVSLSIPFSTNRKTHSSKGFKHFHFLPSLEKLILHPHVLEVLNAGRSSQFPESLNSLKILHLSMFLTSINEVASALFLARNSPQLQMLQFSLYANGTAEGVIEFIRAQVTPDYYLNHIRKVKITVFSGADTEIEFVSYLLASTAALEEFFIGRVSRSSASESSLTELLKQLPRASPSARLILLGR